MNHPRSIAIVLARAGSKGVPGKNVAPIAGRPCIAWTLDFALACARIDHIVVSSDDPRIEGLIRTSYAGKIVYIRRPPELASDTARVDDAARHALTEVSRTDSAIAHPDTRVAILYANIPVRPPGLLDRALDRMPGADSVQSYQAVGKYHPWWMARLADDGAVRPWEGEVLNHGVFRRQDLPPAFVPDGAVLVVTRRALMLEVPGVAPGPHAFFGAIRRGITTQPGEVIDIDSPMDAMVADATLRATTVKP